MPNLGMGPSKQKRDHDNAAKAALARQKKEEKTVKEIEKQMNAYARSIRRCLKENCKTARQIIKIEAKVDKVWRCYKRWGLI